MAEQIIQQNALPIDPKVLLDSIGSSRVVMVGDNTHGTTEFYRFRSDITKSLIMEKGFTLIGIEWDWVDVNRINQYVLGISNDKRAWDALSAIERFPEFMYENHPFEEFVEWLKSYNRTTNQKVSIYGLDIFGIISTLRYLSYNLSNQNELLEKISSVFSNFNPNEYNYGYSSTSVENEVNKLQFTNDFFLDQCIALLKEGEEYYRKKAQNEAIGWNLRDTHMARVIMNLVNEYNAKMVCWLHNTHTGNADAVREFRDEGKISAATLLKRALGKQVYSIGLLTYTGTVTASDHWYGPTIKFKLNPSIKGSFGELFHNAVDGNFILILKDGDPRLLQLISIPEYERFIGGAYNPNNELRDHYVHAQLYPQFDAIVFYNYSNSIE
jgi:erythromycin esterase-like protein